MRLGPLAFVSLTACIVLAGCYQHYAWHVRGSWVDEGLYGDVTALTAPYDLTVSDAGPLLPFENATLDARYGPDDWGLASVHFEIAPHSEEWGGFGFSLAKDPPSVFVVAQDVPEPYGNATLRADALNFAKNVTGQSGPGIIQWADRFIGHGERMGYTSRDGATEDRPENRVWMMMYRLEFRHELQLNGLWQNVSQKYGEPEPFRFEAGPWTFHIYTGSKHVSAQLGTGNLTIDVLATGTVAFTHVDYEDITDEQARAIIRDFYGAVGRPPPDLAPIQFDHTDRHGD